MPRHSQRFDARSPQNLWLNQTEILNKAIGIRCLKGNETQDTHETHDATTLGCPEACPAQAPTTGPAAPRHLQRPKRSRRRGSGLPRPYARFPTSPQPTPRHSNRHDIGTLRRGAGPYGSFPLNPVPYPSCDTTTTTTRHCPTIATLGQWEAKTLRWSASTRLPERRPNAICAIRAASPPTACQLSFRVSTPTTPTMAKCADDAFGGAKMGR